MGSDTYSHRGVHSSSIFILRLADKQHHTVKKTNSQTDVTLF